MSDSPTHSPKRGLAKLSAEGSTAAEQQHLQKDAAAAVLQPLASAIRVLEEQKAQEAQQPGSSSSARAPTAADLSTGAAGAGGQLSVAEQQRDQAALYDVLGIEPALKHAEQRIMDAEHAGKAIPSTYSSEEAASNRIAGASNNSRIPVRVRVAHVLVPLPVCCCILCCCRPPQPHLLKHASKGRANIANAKGTIAIQQPGQRGHAQDTRETRMEWMGTSLMSFKRMSVTQLTLALGVCWLLFGWKVVTNNARTDKGM